jgi:hypothetical protein
MMIGKNTMINVNLILNITDLFEKKVTFLKNPSK